MKQTFLKAKLHRATVTDSDLSYEGSISIDKNLCKEAGLHEFERVEIYNCNNGERFATYVIYGKDGEICINGAAARLVQRKDLVIICSYADLEESEIQTHVPTLVFLDEKNKVSSKKAKTLGLNPRALTNYFLRQSYKPDSVEGHHSSRPAITDRLWRSYPEAFGRVYLISLPYLILLHAEFGCFHSSHSPESSRSRFQDHSARHSLCSTVPRLAAGAVNPCTTLWSPDFPLPQLN